MLQRSLGAFAAVLKHPATGLQLAQSTARQSWRGGAARYSTARGALQRAAPKQGRNTAAVARSSALGSNGGATARFWQRPRQAFFRPAPRRPFHSSRPRRSSKPSSSSPKEEPEESLSLGARLKKLSREYGWAAVGVYLGLSVLDFPFCFLLVRTVGTDKIAEVEHFVVSNVQKFIPERVKEFWHEYRQAARQAAREAEASTTGNNNTSDDVEMAGWGVKEADERHKAEASLATQLALAYAIHKSFIFIRVPLTAAVTPKVVKVLRSWGWKIGKKAA